MFPIRRTIAAVITAATVAIAVAEPALADWQGTTWGASVVATDEAFDLPHRLRSTSSSAANMPVGSEVTGIPLIKFSYADGQFAFDNAAMFFLRGRLFSITMQLIDGKDCEELSARLTRKLSKPTLEAPIIPPDNVFSSRGFNWADKSLNNLVYLQIIKHGDRRFSDECNLSLYPLDGPAPPIS